ncbi:DNA (cytosine-5-)-methyltransferase [Shouchella lonarensis]|uniref:Cytosine-specific methyltransferase n=1 Tax=Shouchella lonarensis TaxID=1464122 RepID=A0A1G6HRB5_9BACI|nr:DNA (cytosine-5-)-methyltransferase [Shouchella lonarensis]SDB96698.1 DNA (cytosine-5)-methyltransferase 1 [Shouchella lonarensis]
MFTYIELFAGIGGFRQALDKANGKCVFASEIDKFARKSYTALYGDEHLHGDITKIDAQDVPDHDLLVGGFPCQAFSVAGNRLGFEDTRGTLFFEIVRIAKEKRPKAMLLENVKGLLGHDGGKTMETMILALNDIGYTVDFTILNSKHFGVPQHRERVFIVALRDDLVDHEPWLVKGTNRLAKSKRQLGKIEGLKTFNFDYPTGQEGSARLRDILEEDVGSEYDISEKSKQALIEKLRKREG